MLSREERTTESGELLAVLDVRYVPEQASAPAGEEPPTPENFARVIYRLLRAALPSGLLYGIRLFEDADTSVELSGDAA